MKRKPITTHVDTHIGVTMDGDVKCRQCTNVDGSPYFLATQKIETIFGANVNGECHGIGRTKKDALMRLNEDIGRLADSLFE